jgi:hypothetical protein
MANEITKTDDTPKLALCKLKQDRLQELIKNNLGDQRLDVNQLDRVTIPSGGSTQWSVPGLQGDQMVPELVGVVIHHQDKRTFWERQMGQGGTQPPDCSSVDGHVGIGVRWQGDPDEPHKCADCKWSRWGSDLRGGKGQACQRKKAIFLLQEKHLLPTYWLASVTSVAVIDKFLVRLLNAGTDIHSVLTRITLTQLQSNEGIKYSRAELNLARELTAQEVEQVKAYRQAIMPVLNPEEEDE